MPARLDQLFKSNAIPFIDSQPDNSSTKERRNLVSRHDVVPLHTRQRLLVRRISFTITTSLARQQDNMVMWSLCWSASIELSGDAQDDGQEIEGRVGSLVSKLRHMPSLLAGWFDDFFFSGKKTKEKRISSSLGVMEHDYR